MNTRPPEVGNQRTLVMFPLLADEAWVGALKVGSAVSPGSLALGAFMVDQEVPFWCILFAPWAPLVTGSQARTLPFHSTHFALELGPHLRTIR